MILLVLLCLVLSAWSQVPTYGTIPTTTIIGKSCTTYYYQTSVTGTFPKFNQITVAWVSGPGSVTVTLTNYTDPTLVPGGLPSGDAAVNALCTASATVSQFGQSSANLDLPCAFAGPTTLYLKAVLSGDADFNFTQTPTTPTITPITDGTRKITFPTATNELAYSYILPADIAPGTQLLIDANPYSPIDYFISGNTYATSNCFQKSGTLGTTGIQLDDCFLKSAVGGKIYITLFGVTDNEHTLRVQLITPGDLQLDQPLKDAISFAIPKYYKLSLPQKDTNSYVIVTLSDVMGSPIAPTSTVTLWVKDLDASDGCAYEYQCNPQQTGCVINIDPCVTSKNFLVRVFTSTNPSETSASFTLSASYVTYKTQTLSDKKYVGSVLPGNQTVFSWNHGLGGSPGDHLVVYLYMDTATPHTSLYLTLRDPENDLCTTPIAACYATQGACSLMLTDVQLSFVTGSQLYIQVAGATGDSRFSLDPIYYTLEVSTYNDYPQITLNGDSEVYTINSNLGWMAYKLPQWSHGTLMVFATATTPGTSAVVISVPNGKKYTHSPYPEGSKIYYAPSTIPNNPTDPFLAIPHCAKYSGSTSLYLVVNSPISSPITFNQLTIATKQYTPKDSFYESLTFTNTPSLLFANPTVTKISPGTTMQSVFLDYTTEGNKDLQSPYVEGTVYYYFQLSVGESGPGLLVLEARTANSDVTMNVYRAPARPSEPTCYIHNPLESTSSAYSVTSRYNANYGIHLPQCKLNDVDNWVVELIVKKRASAEFSYQIIPVGNTHINLDTQTTGPHVKYGYAQDKFTSDATRQYQFTVTQEDIDNNRVYSIHAYYDTAKFAYTWMEIDIVKPNNVGSNPHPYCDCYSDDTEYTDTGAVTYTINSCNLVAGTYTFDVTLGPWNYQTPANDLVPEVTIEISVDETVFDLPADTTVEFSLRDYQIRIFKFTVDSTSDIYYLATTLEQSDGNTDSPTLYYSLSTYPYTDCHNCPTHLSGGYSSTSQRYFTQWLYPCGTAQTYYLHVYAQSGSYADFHNFIIRLKKDIVVPITTNLPTVDTSSDCHVGTTLTLDNPDVVYSLDLAFIPSKTGIFYREIATQYDSVVVTALTTGASCYANLGSGYPLTCATKLFFRTQNVYNTLTYTLCKIPTLSTSTSIPLTLGQTVLYYVKGNSPRQIGGSLKTEVGVTNNNAVNFFASVIPASCTDTCLQAPYYTTPFTASCQDFSGTGRKCTYYFPDVDCNLNASVATADYIYAFTSTSGAQTATVTVSTPTVTIGTIPKDGSYSQVSMAPGEFKIFRFSVSQSDLVLGTTFSAPNITSTVANIQTWTVSTANNPIVPYGDFYNGPTVCSYTVTPPTPSCYGAVEDYYITVANRDPSTANPSIVYLGIDRTLAYKKIDVPAFAAGVTTATSTSDKDVFVLDVPAHQDGEVFRVYLTATTDAAVSFSYNYDFGAAPVAACNGAGLLPTTYAKNDKHIILEETCTNLYPKKLFVTVSSAGVKLDAEIVPPTALAVGATATLTMPVANVAVNEYRSILIKVTGIPTKASMNITINSAPQSFNWQYYITSAGQQPPSGSYSTGYCSSPSGTQYYDGTTVISESALCDYVEQGYMWILAIAINTGNTQAGGATINVVASQTTRTTADLPATLKTTLPDPLKYVMTQTITSDKYFKMTLSTPDTTQYNADVYLHSSGCSGITDTLASNIVISDTENQYLYLLPCSDTPHSAFSFITYGLDNNITVTSGLSDITYTAIKPNHDVGVRVPINQPVFFRHLPSSDNTDPIDRYTNLVITQGEYSCANDYTYTLSTLGPVSTACGNVVTSGTISAGGKVTLSLTSMANSQLVYNSLASFYLTLIPVGSSSNNIDNTEFVVTLQTDSASPLPIVQNIHDREVIDLAFTPSMDTSSAGLCDTATTDPTCCNPNPIFIKRTFIYDLQGSNLINDLRINVETTNTNLFAPGSFSVTYDIPGQSSASRTRTSSPYSIIYGSCNAVSQDGVTAVTVSSSTVQVHITVTATPNSGANWEKVLQLQGNWNFARIYVDADVPAFFPLTLTDTARTQEVETIIKPYQRALFQIELPELPANAKSVRINFIKVDGSISTRMNAIGDWSNCPSGTIGSCSSESLVNADDTFTNTGCNSYCPIQEFNLCDSYNSRHNVLRYQIKSSGGIVTVKVRFTLDVITTEAIPSCLSVPALHNSIKMSTYYANKRFHYHSALQSLSSDQIYRVTVKANSPSFGFALSLIDFSDSSPRNCDVYTANNCNGQCSVIFRGNALPVIRLEVWNAGYYNISEYIETITPVDLGLGLTRYPPTLATGCYDYSFSYYRIPQSLMDNGQKLRLNINTNGQVRLYDSLPQSLLGYGTDANLPQFTTVTSVNNGQTEWILPYHCNGTQDYYLYLPGTTTTIILEQISPVESTLTAGSLTNLPAYNYQTFKVTANNAGPLDSLAISTQGLSGSYWLSGTSGYSSSSCKRASGNSYASCLLQEDEMIYVNALLSQVDTYSYAYYNYNPVTVIPSSQLPVRVAGSSVTYIQFDLTGITSDSILALYPKYPTSTATLENKDQSYVLYKGRLTAGATACSTGCSSSGDASTRFTLLDTVQSNRIQLFSPCFHCSGAYSSFYVEATAGSFDNVDLYPVLQVLNAVEIADGDITIGNTTNGAEGLYYFKFDQDYTTPSDVVITVSSGAINVGYYGQTVGVLDPVVGCNPQTTLRYKVCVAGVPCKLGGTSLGEHFYYGREGYSKTVYATVVGTATFSISRAAPTCVDAPSTKSSNENITFCTGVDLAKSVMPYTDQKSTDAYAKALAAYLTNQVKQSYTSVYSHSACQQAIEEYACNMAFKKCSTETNLEDSKKSEGLCDDVQAACLVQIYGQLSCNTPYVAPTIISGSGVVTISLLVAIVVALVHLF